MRGADLLVRTLAAHGVRAVFTLSGNQIMPVFDAVIGTDIRLVHVRHEAAAVQMAEAWAQITGGIGVALLTAGPGFANGLSALYSARASETPLLLLSGDVPSAQAGLGAFQEMDQKAAASPFVKATARADSAAGMGPAVAGLVRLALSGRPGPVHLALPVDHLEASAGEARPAQPLPLTAPALDREAARVIADTLAQAKWPLVLVGPHLARHQFTQQRAALGEAMALPVVALDSPRGLADPSLGAFGDLLPSADRILLLGKPVDFSLGFGRAVPKARIFQIDPDEANLERSRALLGDRLAAASCADALASLHLLAQAAAGHPAPDRRGWLTEVASALAYRPRDWAGIAAGGPGGLHPVAVLRAVQEALDAAPDSILVSDGGEFGQWALACLKARRWVKNGPAGAIGAAIPYAIAARLADPTARVIAVTGDGSAGFHLVEIDTAVRAGAPVVAVIGNDARWNAEHQIQLRDYGPDRLIGCLLRETRYDEAARALGGHGALAEDGPALVRALHQAFGETRPVCINVRLDGQPAPTLTKGAAGSH